MTDHVRRPAAGLGEFVDVERRCVAGQDAVGPGDLAQSFEDLPLERHVLEGRLDDEVGPMETGQGGSRHDGGERCVTVRPG